MAIRHWKKINRCGLVTDPLPCLQLQQVSFHDLFYSHIISYAAWNKDLSPNRICLSFAIAAYLFTMEKNDSVSFDAGKRAANAFIC
jgi:hypothetical protein